MTNVFVSYSRADKDRVEPLVAFVNSVVGEVWWDDRLIAGESFIEETERRLNKADFVVVVWTPNSVRSKWVLDEAAVGRDAGKLLPVSFDGQIPPLGFRHVHTTDFSKWNGDADDKCAAALKIALLRTRGTAPAWFGPSSPLAWEARALFRRRSYIAAGALTMIIAAVAAFQLSPARLAGPPRGSIAVLPFADLSAAHDRAYFAEGIAEEILSALARDSALKVIGRTSSAKFARGDFDMADVRRALNVEHILEGSVRAAAGRIKVNVALLRTRDGVRVWSEEYDRPEADIFTIESEVGEAVANHLGGGQGSQPVAASTTRLSALDLLLEARQKLRERTPEGSLEARRLLERAITLDPASAAINGALAEAVWWTNEARFYPAEGEDPNKARELAEKAIALDPGRADGYAALALILSDQPAAQRPILEKAVALDPSRSDLKMWLAGQETDLEKYLEQMRTVIAFDPLWPRPVQNLAMKLTEFGRFEEAERVIADYAARAPDDRTNPFIFHGEIAEARGDLASAYAALSKIAPQTDESRFERARYLANLGMDKEAAVLLPNPKIPPEANVRRNSEANFRLIDAIPRFVTAIPYELLADHRRGADILHLYDSKLGEAVKFCAKISEFGVDRGSPALVWALQGAKRNDESQTISACAEAEFKRRIAAGSEVGFSHFYIAQLEALAGKRASAIARLRSALDAQYRGNRYSLDLREYRAFDALQDSPEFLAIQKRIDGEAARQRAAVLRFDQQWGKTLATPG